MSVSDVLRSEHLFHGTSIDQRGLVQVVTISLTVVSFIPYKR